MNKAFTRETDREDDDDDEVAAAPLPQGAKNYITAAGYARLRAELMTLLDDERPKIVEIVSWAAKNGDRSENGDYLYGKKRLREIDRRIRFLTKRLDIAEVVEPSLHHGSDQVFFGATVRYSNDRGEERTVRIIGVDEAESAQRRGQLDRADRACAAQGAGRRRAEGGDAARPRDGRGPRRQLSGALTAPAAPRLTA